MGYCIHQEEAKFRIERANFAKALAALKKMPGRYSWVGDAFKKLDSLVEILARWRWQVKVSDVQDGAIVSIQFCGEKAGDDKALFSALAPFVEAGSFIHMIGEDGAQWKWVFNGKKCEEKHAKVSFD